jgi:hypothetical protein
MKISHRQAVVLSGVIWFAIGLMLLAKGLKFLVLGGQVPGKEQLVLFLIVGALIVGFLKGRFVLAKTVKRVVGRIETKPNPFPFSGLYPVSYYLLILGMVLLGVSMRFLPIAVEIRGAIDVAIGSALMNGALAYFRTAMAGLKKGS